MSVSLAPTLIPLLTAVSTSNTGALSSAWIDCQGKDTFVIYFQSNGTTSGGTMVIEESYAAPNALQYSGTASQIGTTINASSFTGSAQLAVHIAAPCAINWLRVRLATDITGGGTVTIALKMQ